jgi:aryl-alcohol dehydrogenase-like predicted oxidoreductase
MDQTTKPAAGAGTIRLGELTVNRLGFGAMRVTGPGVWGEPPDRKAAIRLLQRAFELGHSFIDTADSYGPEVSENLIAEALYPYPKELVIGTKGGLVRPGPNRWDRSGKPEHLRQALDGSLKRLKLERIDLYQFHAPDDKVPFADSMGVLAELQRAGKIHHLGVSNVRLRELEQARSIAPIVSVQNRYNLEDRGHEDVLTECEKVNIAFIPWYPLGAGDALGSKKVKHIASKLGATPSQVLLAWLLARSPVILPIPGTGSIEHLEENAAAAVLKLTAEDMDSLSEIH